MKPTTKVTLAALLSAAGSFITALASEFSDGPASPEAAAQPEAPKSTRKKKEAQPEPEGAPAEAPAEPAAPAEAPAEPAAPAEVATGGKDLAELRAIIDPAVKVALGNEVKKIINKYVGKPQSTLTELVNLPQHHAAFEKDISALLY